MFLVNLIGIIYIFFTKAKFYKEVTRKDPKGNDIKVKIYTRKKFRKKTRRGLCYGKYIVVLESLKDNKRLFKHEFKHTLQYREVGIFYFPLYALETIKARKKYGKEFGYWYNKFELEAREYAEKAPD